MKGLSDETKMKILKLIDEDKNITRHGLIGKMVLTMTIVDGNAVDVQATGKRTMNIVQKG